MARDRSAQALERVRELLGRSDDPSLRAELAGLLARESGIVVASIARGIEARSMSSLQGELCASFARLLAPRSDPQCLGKRAIARTLVKLEVGAAALDVYRSGIRHVQLEAVYGGKVDTAAELRALCAHGLVLVGGSGLWASLADLLADATSQARSGAVRAIAQAGNAFVGAPLLRLRVRSGEPDGRVTSECLAALLQLDPDESFELVLEHLRSANPVIAEGAALALGESRLPAALGALCEWLERCADVDLRRSGYLAIALLRSDAATDFLLGELQSAPPDHAAHALEALAVQRTDERLRARAQDAVAARGDAQLSSAFADAFGASTSA
jgi:hypothetical protein